MSNLLKDVLWIRLGIALLQAFNGFSGLLGGYLLIKDPTGNSLSLSLEWLASTPFSDFFIPGLVLFSLNGIGNIIGLVMTATKHQRAGEVAMLFGSVLIIWIIFQVFWIGYQGLLQPIYFLTGLMQLLLGLALTKSVQKKFVNQ